MTNKECEILIIGAGPSGLASGNFCLYEGIDFFVVDIGKDSKHRAHDNPDEIVTGIGGSGLFSDGKLSYYPSSHALYSLPSSSLLKKAYTWFHNLTSDIIPEAPEYPSVMMSEQWYFGHAGKDFTEKKYQTIYLNDGQMVEILKRLTIPIAHRIQPRIEIIKIENTPNGYKSTAKSLSQQVEFEILSQGVIFCGGRFGPLSLRTILPNIPVRYRRFEYGIRIQQKVDDFFASKFRSIDTKLICNSKDNKLQWRTFCCCHRGKVFETNFNGLNTLSGSRGDSENSNVGFNVRIKDPTIYNENIDQINRLFRGDVKPFRMPLRDFIDNSDAFGKYLTEYLKIGLKKLVSEFSLDDSMAYGPCIEGVGFYPDITAELELTSNETFYVAGDSTGVFRGLLSAILSGYYVADRVSKSRFKDVRNKNSRVQIKHSSIDTMPIIFTAQSKRYFYCRDAICEYVLKRHALPINPFRVFDYFLSDRVDRDIIRRGNNHLINMCDELWVFGPIADGVLFEIIYSLNIQRPVRFFQIGTKADEIRPINSVKDITFEQEIHLAGHKKEDLLKEIEHALTKLKPGKKQLELPFK